VIDTTHTDLNRYRAATLWCVSRLQFQQTSGRDQSPMDITQRSLIGRCEEMQILFVAAARTVGLPSRPASTPWWAHMDNNHAWAEVFLDGAWHYTGDMDSAWFPDQTWFSGMIDKTVMILADGSMAAENDEVLATGNYDTLINSTRNYAKERSRTIKLKVQDSRGLPLSNARVIPMVFNWGSLRAITYLNTDDDGFLKFSAGRGAFFLSVYHKGKKALQYVPSSSDEVVELTVTPSETDFSPDLYSLEYPSNPMHWDSQPEAYRAAVQQEKQRWQQKVDAFDRAAHELSGADSLGSEVAMACRGNYPAFKAFWERNKPVDDAFLDFLLIYDPKFLWQASAAQMEALYSHFKNFSGSGFEGEELLSLCSPSVYYEDLPQPFVSSTGKSLLYPAELNWQVPCTRNGVIAVLTNMQKKYRINAAKALSGLPTLDIACRQKYLSSVQYRILACSILRANGFPAEFSRIPDLVSVFIDGDWQYVNIKKLNWEDQTERQETNNFTLELQLKDEHGIPIHLGEEQMTLCRYQEGVFYPLNDRFEYQGSGLYKGTFPASEAYLQVGYRVSDSLTRFSFMPLAAQANDSLSFALTLPEYPRSWKSADEDILALIDKETLDSQSLILLGSLDQENSRRIADKLNSQNIPFLWMGSTEARNAPANYRLNPLWQDKVGCDCANALRSITLFKSDSGWQMFEGLWDKLPQR